MNPFTKFRFLAGFLLMMAGGCAVSMEQDKSDSSLGALYQISWADGMRSSEPLGKINPSEIEWMTSSYFDRAMSFQRTRFRAMSFKTLLKKYASGNADALLLNCFDDYQGILTLEEIKRYDLYLATRIELESRAMRPGWLNPLLILVPDGSPAPFEEKFLTANIRELRFIQSKEYYAPVLRKVGQGSAGFEIYKNNCLFCHSIKGENWSVGGSKGPDLIRGYSFGSNTGRRQFEQDFSAFHNKDNQDKQNMEQFMNPDRMHKVENFLQNLQS